MEKDLLMKLAVPAIASVLSICAAVCGKQAAGTITVSKKPLPDT